MWKLPSFLILLALTILSWASWHLVYSNISPYESPEVAFPSFYISLFFAISFSSSIFCALCWKIFFPTSSHYNCLKNGLREGILLGIGSTIALIFLQFASISWREILLISTFILTLELIFFKTTKICTH